MRRWHEYYVDEPVDYRPPYGYFEVLDHEGYSLGWYKRVLKHKVFKSSSGFFPKAPRTSKFSVCGVDCIIIGFMKEYYGKRSPNEKD